MEKLHINNSTSIMQAIQRISNTCKKYEHLKKYPGCSTIQSSYKYKFTRKNFSLSHWCLNQLVILTNQLKGGE